MGKGSTAVRGALFGVLLIPAGAEAANLRVIAPPGRPVEFYLVPQDIIRVHRTNQQAVTQKLQGPSGSQWGPRGITQTPRTDRPPVQWYIFPVCNGVVTAPGKLVEPTDPTAQLACP